MCIYAHFISYSFMQICPTMHQGKALKEIIEQSGVTLKTVAQRVNRNRNTITNWCNQEKISNESLILVGKALRLDMREYFPHLRTDPDAEELAYFNEDPAQYLKQISEIKDKITDHSQSVADKDLEIKLLREKVDDLKEIIRLKETQIQTLSEKLEKTTEG